jgi:Flp pilus assembly protein TadG
MRLPPILTNWRRLRRDSRGVAAVEFALVVPIVIVVYAVGFELAQASTVYRKLTDMTVQLANVTSQYTTVGDPDLTNIFGASSQILSPYSSAPLTIVLSEVKTDASSHPTVAWSVPYPSTVTPLTCGAAVVMPAGLASPSSHYILVQTTYAYTPTLGGAFMSGLPMTNQVFMIPRESPSIPCTSALCCLPLGSQ